MKLNSQTADGCFVTILYPVSTKPFINVDRKLGATIPERCQYLLAANNSGSWGLQMQLRRD
jgi:hypothetical protein